MAAYTETERIGWLLWVQAARRSLPSVSETAHYLGLAECEARSLLERVESPSTEDRKVWALRVLVLHMTNGATLDCEDIQHVTGYGRTATSQMMTQLSRVIPLRSSNLWFIQPSE